MFHWLEVMTHPDRRISFFNDAAFGIAPSIDDLSKYIERSFKKTSGRSSKIGNPLVTFHSSGFSSVRNYDYHAIIDHGETGPNYLGGHSHADTLSFELSLFGHRVIVNSGTSLYQNHSSEERDINLRHHQRSTCMHSTLELDDLNSSEVWSEFRLARRARILDFKSKHSENQINIVAIHDGYKRLPGNPIHNREWQFSSRSLMITDDIIGKYKHSIKLNFPLHPDVEIKYIKGNVIFLEFHGHKLRFIIANFQDIEIKKSNFYPEFGLSIENKKLVLSSDACLPAKIITKVEW